MTIKEEAIQRVFEALKESFTCEEDGDIIMVKDGTMEMEFADIGYSIIIQPLD